MAMAMAERRHRVLDFVMGAEAPVGVSEIAAVIGVHTNTARFHLEALVAAGYLQRVAEDARGPGRPRVGYRPRPLTARGGVRHYRVLAEALLGQLSTTNADPPAAATAAGRAWGAFLVQRPPPFAEAGPDAAVGRLTTMLDELDFAPEPVADQDGHVDRIRLRHCPFLELAQPHRDLVCPLHLGLMRGALSELGASVTVSALEPFAEPTACLAHLARSA